MWDLTVYTSNAIAAWALHDLVVYVLTLILILCLTITPRVIRYRSLVKNFSEGSFVLTEYRIDSVGILGLTTILLVGLPALPAILFGVLIGCTVVIPMWLLRKALF